MNILKPFNWFKALFKKEKPTEISQRKNDLRKGELEVLSMGDQKLYILIGGIDGFYEIPEKERNCRIAWDKANEKYFILVDIENKLVRDLSDRQLKKFDFNLFPLTIVK